MCTFVLLVLNPSTHRCICFSRVSSPLLQLAPHHLLPAVQAHGRRMRLHPSGLQVVQLGDPRVHRWQTLVGVRGPHGDVAAAGR